MTGTELKSYVASLLDGRTDLDTQIARALAAAHREIQGNIIIPPGRPRRLDWQCQYKGAVAAVWVAGGIAPDALVDEECTLKRVLRMAATDDNGNLTPLTALDAGTVDALVTGDVRAPLGSVWAMRGGKVVIEPVPATGQTYQLDLFQYLPWVADDADDWFTVNAWEALAKGAAARVAGDAGEQIRPSRWREDFLALALALQGDDRAAMGGGTADGIRPEVPSLGWRRGGGWCK